MAQFKQKEKTYKHFLAYVFRWENAMRAFTGWAFFFYAPKRIPDKDLVLNLFGEQHLPTHFLLFLLGFILVIGGPDALTWLKNKFGIGNQP